jgi:hypothetical protein
MASRETKPHAVRLTHEMLVDLCAGRDDKQIAKAIREMAEKGRPRKALNLVELSALCAIGATNAEIAAHFSLTERAIEKRWAKDPVFRSLADRGRQQGKTSLRRAQFQSAMGGSASLQIWLGKQWLGQRDELTVNGSDRLDEMLGALKHAETNQGTSDLDKSE